MNAHRAIGTLAAALVTAAGLTGCGDDQGRADGAPSPSASPAAARQSPGPGPVVTTPRGPATAPGRDDAAPPRRTFTGGELREVLLPDSAFGPKLRAGESHTMPFESTREQRRSHWQDCLSPGENPAWLGPDSYRGTVVTAISVHVDRKANAWREVGSQTLTSLTVASARALLHVEQDIMRHCPSFAADAEAGTASKEYTVEPLEGIGDEAFLETHTLNNEGRHTSYTVHARVGGVLLTVSDGLNSGREHAIAWAAQLARKAGSTLYP